MWGDETNDEKHLRIQADNQELKRDGESEDKKCRNKHTLYNGARLLLISDFQNKKAAIDNKMQLKNGIPISTAATRNLACDSARFSVEISVGVFD